MLHSEILRYEEILRIVKAGVKLGITKVRVTGGEPLVRKGVYDFLHELGGIVELKDISLTTNAVLLKDNAKKIRSSGINRINTSLDTLKRDKFKKITGVDLFDQVMEGIEVAMETGFNPIKINVVAMRGFNDDEFIDLAGLSISNPVHVRFIEHMPIGSTGQDIGDPLLTPEIKKIIAPIGNLIPVKNGIDDGPAERFKIKGALGEIGFISPLSRHFCDTCNRLRLTAKGGLRSCLLSDKQVDVKTPLRNGCDEKALIDIFLKVVSQKPKGHALGTGILSCVTDHMSSIGG